MLISLKYSEDIRKDKSMKLEEIRTEINKIDRDLVLLIGRRFELVRKIAFIKKRDNLHIEDIKKEKEVIRKIKQLGSRVGVNSILLIKVFRLIIKESKKEQKKII